MAHILVTGGAGFIGANLTDRLAAEGHQVLVYDALLRPGVEENLQWLRRRHPRQIAIVAADIRDAAALRDALQGAEAVLHLAAQVAVTTSLEDPAEDFAVNLQGTFQLLELLRQRRGEPCPLIFASTNKVYGGLSDIVLDLRDEAWLPRESGLRCTGIGEDRPLAFHTPYGCSKGGADQYVLDFARSYRLPAAVLRMSCIYGPRQMGTEDQGWVAHFVIRALRGEPITLYGDGMQVRDILHVRDAVEAWLGAWRRIDRIAGQALNIGGGPANAVSLLQVLHAIGDITGRRIAFSHGAAREGDQRWFVADARRARRALGLAEPTPWRHGLHDLTKWLRAERGVGPGERRAAEAVR